MMKNKILIIDDEPDLVETMSYILQARNYVVITASDGLEGLEKVKTERPNLILLDIMMPNVSGYDVCMKLKSDNSTKDIPTIIMSSKGESESVLKSRRLGADAYVVKPCNMPMLLDKIRKFIDR